MKAVLNTIEDLRSGHFKNSYGVEGMRVTGRSDYKKIIDVSDEMKEHVLKNVKQAYYKYNGMSGDNAAEERAYQGTLNEYYKTLDREDRLSACWTLGQLGLKLSQEVSDSIKEKVPGSRYRKDCLMRSSQETVLQRSWQRSRGTRKGMRRIQIS